MFLISVEAAGLMAQILPAFILILVLEGHRLTVTSRRKGESAQTALNRSGKHEGDRVVLILANMVATGLCIYFVQRGSDHLHQLAELGALPASDRGPLVFAQIASGWIYASPVAVFLFLIMSACRMNDSDLTKHPLYKDAVKEVAERIIAEERAANASAAAAVSELLPGEQDLPTTKDSRHTPRRQ